MTFEGQWEKSVHGSLVNDPIAKALAKTFWNAAIKQAAEVAKGTVCDVHLPTGVRIYGMPASVAILELLESK